MNDSQDTGSRIRTWTLEITAPWILTIALSFVGLTFLSSERWYDLPQGWMYVAFWAAPVLPVLLGGFIFARFIEWRGAARTGVFAIFLIAAAWSAAFPILGVPYLVLTGDWNGFFGFEETGGTVYMLLAGASAGALFWALWRQGASDDRHWPKRAIRLGALASAPLIVLELGWSIEDAITLHGRANMNWWRVASSPLDLLAICIVSALISVPAARAIYQRIR